MSTDAIGYLLVLLVICGTFVSVKYRNMLLTLGTAALWATLLAFILANTTAGTNWQSMFILSVVAFLCAFALISFINRRRGDGSVVENFGKLRNGDDKDNSEVETDRGIMDLSNSEYRDYIRARMRNRRRG